MAKHLAEGDFVRVAERDTTAADAKTGLYYPHYRGLTGTIAKVYGDGTAAVAVRTESLPDEIRRRHEAGSSAERQRWLDRLSDEARNRLSAAEKRFSLRYTILVAVADLTRAKAPADAEAIPARRSLAELEAEEARHLEEIAARKKA